MSKKDAAGLKRYAIQIATQLPENRDDALRVLEYVREIVEWENPAATPDDGVVPIIKLFGRSGA